MNTKIILSFFLLGIAGSLLTLHAQTWNTVGDSTQIINYDSVTPGGTVYVIKHIDSLLYVGGAFNYIGNMRVNGIATWDGATWDSLGTSIYDVTYDICKFNNDLYVGGYYKFIKWDGNTWSAIGTGLSVHDVNALKFKNKLYLGGSDIKLNSANLHNIASWDGSNYAGLNGGVKGPYEHVKALTEYNDELIVGGVFNYAGSHVAFNIASWDGNNWHDLDTGTSSIVNALTVDSINNFLFVGGGFSNVGGNDGINTRCVAQWDGFQWDSIGPSLNFGDAIVLTFYQNKLFAGFCASGTVSNLFYLASWDGKQWAPISGPNCTVHALEAYNDELYVGGCFTMINTDSVFGIARYYEPPELDSCTFIQPLIHAMPYGTKEVGDTIYTTPPYNIQFYTNNKYASNWSWDFGDGNTTSTREPTHTYAAPGTYDVTLEVIHPHNLSSQVCTLNVSKTITIIDNTAINETQTQKTEYLGQNIPNPFSKTTTIPYNVPAGSKGFLQITDTKGELIDEYALQQGKNKLEISMVNYKAGVYFYSLVLDGVVVESKRMIFSND